MSVARRPLLTATAAGTLLCALWFVPSANATAERQAAQQPGAGSATETQTSGGHELRLAETGSVDTTPYVIGGTAFLAVGAGFVAYSVRRRGEYAV
ncbi:LAETG motif-containing sortase-dependent surface protein [Streptomyces sp. NPDC015127]|uniref:LAETG motif-containing sortase-dependent surface protein n=1 Tax=Streptomyces sp. NPDC015127 TaxID=3364939 RepID=UPI0037028845